MARLDRQALRIASTCDTNLCIVSEYLTGDTGDTQWPLEEIIPRGSDALRRKRTICDSMMGVTARITLFRAAFVTSGYPGKL